jgi:hypothetical protein
MTIHCEECGTKLNSGECTFCYSTYLKYIKNNNSNALKEFEEEDE